jgi:diacylglycerol kinase (ATP)
MTCMVATPPIEPIDKPPKGKTGIARIVQAFFSSCAGLADAFRHEAAFRQEVALAVVLIPAALLMNVSATERVLLVGSMMLVLIVELLNTGIEVTIDRISYERHPLSKLAKDVGSAAVLLSLVLLGLVWAIIALPKIL